MSLDANGNPIAAPATAPATNPAPTNPAAPVNAYFQQPAAPQPAVAQPPVPANPAAPAEPAAPTNPAAQPGLIPLTPEQFQSLVSAQTELARINAEREADRVRIEREQAEARTRQGDLENGLAQLRQQSDAAIQAERTKLQQIEDRAKRYALDGELGRALSAHPLVPGGADQLAHLWRAQFVVDAQGDSFAVRTPTFQTVGDFVSQQLARPEYAHFVRAQNPGGGIQPNAAAPTPVNPAVQTQPIPAAPAPATTPKNMGEAALLHMQQQLASRPTGGDAIMDRSMAFGLRRVN